MTMNISSGYDSKVWKDIIWRVFVFIRAEAFIKSKIASADGKSDGSVDTISGCKKIIIKL